MKNERIGVAGGQGKHGQELANDASLFAYALLGLCIAIVCLWQ